MKKLKILIFLSLIFCSLNAQKQRLENEIYSIIKNKKATIGVAIIYDGKDTLTIHNDNKYPTMSVFKFHQSLALLDFMNKNLLSLDSKVFIKNSDIDAETYSPLAKECPNGNFYISIGDLIKYTVSQSDNNTSNFLFNYMNGTLMTDMYIRTLGIKNFSITMTEKEMEGHFNNQYVNWTTPLEAAKLLEIFLKKDLFSNNFKDFLIQAMIDTSTGNDKLKASLPENIILGHKTGSSSRNANGLKAADNDIGFIYLPNGKQYTIAIFVKDSKEDDQTNANIIANISKAVFKFYKDIENYTSLLKN